jgi:hypothetical protein
MVLAEQTDCLPAFWSVNKECSTNRDDGSDKVRCGSAVKALLLYRTR